MTSDRVLAVLSMAMFIGFAGIVAYFVNETELWVVLIIVILMAMYDFWTELRSGAKRNPHDL